MADLEIRDLTVEVDGSDILRGVNLDLDKGKTLALMGPNGSGKSTLAYAIAGHPAYDITGGTIRWQGTDLVELAPDDRARLGVFLAMQYPVEVPGVSLTNFLRTALNATNEQDVPIREFMSRLRAEMAELSIEESFLQRSVNEGFSGGEKKRFEILQMAMLKPQLAVLDETDSGLDVDALKVVSEGVNRLTGPDLGTLIITHYTRILRYIRPDEVHVMFEGRIVASGGAELADELEERGYDHLKTNA
ncbi:Fe-S cluster assembly ATPase SufC [Egicoccus halophilus]|uniref:ABC transporter ATP-binding protein n=1 Tax=Egicoccus halophilus TaxID=1670830 RepID=A0A8J3ACH5_9ACTN|nr:Fe-S cluster assembly ATPase SufC [Egicoccus halophilus]GGI05074.1 ABC transporter ATP-binding protein [Egicoccus halophilus]